MNNLVPVVRQFYALFDLLLIISIIEMPILLSTFWPHRRYPMRHSVRGARLYSALLDVILIGGAITMVFYGVALIVGLWTLWGTKGFHVHHFGDLLWLASQCCAFLDVMTIGFAMDFVVIFLASIVTLWDFWSIWPFWSTSHE